MWFSPLYVRLDWRDVRRKAGTEQEGKGRAAAGTGRSCTSESAEASRLGRLARPAKDSHRRAQGGRRKRKPDTSFQNDLRETHRSIFKARPRTNPNRRGIGCQSHLQ
jgi:hypothetical protein